MKSRIAAVGLALILVAGVGVTSVASAEGSTVTQPDTVAAGTQAPAPETTTTEVEVTTTPLTTTTEVEAAPVPLAIAPLPTLAPPIVETSSTVPGPIPPSDDFFLEYKGTASCLQPLDGRWRADYTATAVSEKVTVLAEINIGGSRAGGATPLTHTATYTTSGTFVDSRAIAAFDYGLVELTKDVRANRPESGCLPPKPVFPPDETTSRVDCSTGDTEVTVISTITTFVAVWNTETKVWDKEVEALGGGSGPESLNEAEQERCRPDSDVVTTEWADEGFDCDDTSVWQTRTVTTTSFDYIDAQWAAGDPVVVKETQTRDLTTDEIHDCLIGATPTTMPGTTTVPTTIPTTMPEATTTTTPTGTLPATGSNGNTTQSILLMALTALLGGLGMAFGSRRRA